MLTVGIILFVIGVIAALAWRRDAGVIMAVIGAVIVLVALLAGDGSISA